MIREAVGEAPQGYSRDALETLARRFGWRLVVLFGSEARGGDGRDVDLAVMPVSVPGLFEQGRWVSALEALYTPRPLDLLLLTDHLAPLARFEVFRIGRCLFEEREGLFGQEQDRAFFLYADSAKFRRAAGRCFNAGTGGKRRSATRHPDVNTYFVARHAGARAWAREQGIEIDRRWPTR